MSAETATAEAYRDQRRTTIMVEEQQSLMQDWQSAANRSLSEAMRNERCRQWNKVIANYTELLDILSQVIPNDDKERPAWLTLLLYESHFHLGVALQCIKQPKRAIEEFSRAIKSVFIKRSDCPVPRCRVASCLVTPVYARRAFAYANSGDLKNATLDAEKAVVLDSSNPDVYCIRALVLNTCNKITQAVEDIRKAVRLNKSHVCALILKGAMEKKICKNQSDSQSGILNQTLPSDHRKAVKLYPDSLHYLTVDNFRHQQIFEFYDRFLFSLSVPHTISSMMTTDNGDAIQANKSEEKQMKKKSEAEKPISKSQSLSSSNQNNNNKIEIQPRSHSEKPKRNPTGDLQRAFDAHKSAVKSHYSVRLTPRETLHRRTVYGQTVSIENSNPTIQPKYVSLESSDTATDEKGNCLSEDSLKDISTQQQRIRTPNSIQVFQEVNLNETPRLYYRPWMGDRMSIPDIERRKQELLTPFKV